MFEFNRGRRCRGFEDSSIPTLFGEGILDICAARISRYHVLLEPTHAILARACLTVLLQFDDKTDQKRLSSFPAAEHWVDHPKIENVVSEIEDAMARLFDPKKRHDLTIYIFDHDRRQRSMDDLAEYPAPPQGTPLFYAALCGFSHLANYLINMYGEDINAECWNRLTPLHSASSRGRVEVVELLLRGSANVNARNRWGWTSLHVASVNGHTKAAQLLLSYAANVDARDEYDHTPLILASFFGKSKVVRLLLGHGADVHAKENGGRSALYWA